MGENDRSSSFWRAANNARKFYSTGRKGFRLWKWVAGLLAVLVVAALIAGGDDDDDDDAEEYDSLGSSISVGLFAG